MKRRLLACSVTVAACGVVAACVGDDPILGSTPDAAAIDGSTTPPSDAAPSDGATPDEGGGPADAGGGGPRCTPGKPFETVELMKGISSSDDETGVWVAADELTAYVAVHPQAGSGSRIRKSVRATRAASFSTAVDDPQLAAITAGGFAVTVPSMTSDGLVFVTARANNGTDDGMYVAVRSSTSMPFSAPVRARSRANPISFGDPFIAPGGQSLFLGRDNGPNSFELDEAPRDIAMIYGDGGFVDYQVAPNVVNVNDAVASDRRPVVSADRLTLAFASNRAPGSGADTDIYIAHRAGVGGVFTSPLRLPEPVSSNATDLPGTLSSDGCALYFTSSRAGGFGGFDVYMALRGK